MTKAQTNYYNKLQNKLTDLNQQLKDEHLKLFNQTYLAELERDLLNPHKPAKDFKKPQPKHNNPLSEMYIDNKNPPTLSKDQTTVHNHIFSFYNSLFSHKPCNDNFSNLQNFMDGIDLDKITQEENTALERPITKTDRRSEILLRMPSIIVLITIPFLQDRKLALLPLPQTRQGP